jgi:hypothetical protein
MSNVIPKEMAEQEFERMCQSRRVETDVEEMDKDARASFEWRKKLCLKALMRGELTVDGEGDPTYTPPVQGSRALTFRKLTGATLISNDRAAGPMAAIAAAVAEATQTSPVEVAKLDAKDFRFCCELVNLFLVE